MDTREIKILGNIMALAKRGGKGAKSKRSMMLRMIMPHLSQETGDMLADAIAKGNTAKFNNAWNKVRDEIGAKLKQRHAAHAGADEQFTAEDGFFKVFGEEFGRMMDQINAKRNEEIAAGRIYPKGSPLYKAEDDPIAHLP